MNCLVKKRIYSFYVLLLFLFVVPALVHASYVFNPLYSFTLVGNYVGKNNYEVNLSGFEKPAEYTCEVALSCGSEFINGCDYQIVNDDGISPVVKGSPNSVNHLKVNVILKDDMTSNFWLYSSSKLSTVNSVSGCVVRISEKNNFRYMLGIFFGFAVVGVIFLAVRS